MSPDDCGALPPREDDVYEAASYVRKAKKFFIQEFRPDCTLSPAYARIRPFPPDKIARIRATVAEIMTINDQVCETPKQRFGVVSRQADMGVPDQPY